MLTAHQTELKAYIIRHMDANMGVAPSYDEMKDAMGLASKSGIHRLMVALEERGHIRRIPNKARAIQILVPMFESTQKLLGHTPTPAALEVPFLQTSQVTAEKCRLSVPFDGLYFFISLIGLPLWGIDLHRQGRA